MKLRWYDIGSDFDAFGTTLTNVDLYACSWPKSSNDTADEFVSFNYSACIESESIYLDPNIPADYQFPKISSKSDEYPYSQCVETSFGSQCFQFTQFSLPSDLLDEHVATG